MKEHPEEKPGAFALSMKKEHRLTIEYLDPHALKPYKNNAKIHDEENVDMLAGSIEEFDFNDPIGIWGKDNLIVEGHGRQLAAIRAGLSEVPCIRLDHLSAEQRRAYALAHNRTAELSDWDEALKSAELKTIKNLDMSQFGFDLSHLYDDEMEDEDDDGYYGDERERTFNSYNLHEFDAGRVAGPYDLPILRKCSEVPTELMGFNYVLNTTDRSKGVHFFIDDYQFERVWTDPMTYVMKLTEFPCVLTPDFSLYTDMPMAMKIWNVYRSRLIGQMMQDRGINVIPTIQFAGEETLDWVFEGIEGGGTVATSTVGVMRDPASRKIWTAGMERAIAEIRPKTVLCYGTEMKEFDWQGVDVVTIRSRQFE